MVRREILRWRLYLRSRNSPVVERSGGYSSGLSNARLRVHKVISSGSQPCFRLVMPKPPFGGWRSPPPQQRLVGVDAEAISVHPSTGLQICRPCPLFVFVTVPPPVTSVTVTALPCHPTVRSCAGFRGRESCFSSLSCCSPRFVCNRKNFVRRFWPLTCGFTQI